MERRVPPSKGCPFPGIALTTDEAAMNKHMIVRAWKDPGYRASLSAEQRESLPENPSGQSLTELDDAELGEAVGGQACPPRHTQVFRFCNPDITFILNCPTRAENLTP